MIGFVDRARGLSDKLRMLSQLSGTAQYAAFEPYLERAVQMHQVTARGMILNRLNSSGLASHTGSLKHALNAVRLVLTWKNGVPDLKLVVPGGLPESMYKRIWSLDRGWKVKGKKVSHPWKCFTLTTSEKNSLGEQIRKTATTLMNSDRSKNHGG